MLRLGETPRVTSCATTGLKVRTFRGEASRRSVDPPVDNSSGAPLPATRSRKSASKNETFSERDRTDNTGGKANFEEAVGHPRGKKQRRIYRPIGDDDDEHVLVGRKISLCHIVCRAEIEILHRNFMQRACVATTRATRELRMPGGHLASRASRLIFRVRGRRAGGIERSRRVRACVCAQFAGVHTSAVYVILCINRDLRLASSAMRLVRLWAAAAAPISGI